jgi:hypothetical protein
MAPAATSRSRMGAPVPDSRRDGGPPGSWQLPFNDPCSPVGGDRTRSPRYRELPALERDAQHRRHALTACRRLRGTQRSERPTRGHCHDVAVGGHRPSAAPTARRESTMPSGEVQDRERRICVGEPPARFGLRQGCVRSRAIARCLHALNPRRALRSSIGWRGFAQPSGMASCRRARDRPDHRRRTRTPPKAEGETAALLESAPLPSRRRSEGLPSTSGGGHCCLHGRPRRSRLAARLCVGRTERIPASRPSWPS